MNTLVRLGRKIACLSIFLCVPVSVSAADIFKADGHFAAKEYELAKEEYLKGAQVGNPHAYYQLSAMYQQGLGVKKDALNALIYLSLAADYDLEKANTTLEGLLEPLDDATRQTIDRVLQEYKKNNGKAVIQQKFFPQVVAENLTEKFTFDDEPNIEPKFYVDDIDSEEYTSSKLPFLIVEHDIGPDGIIRNMFNIQKMGNTLDIIDEYKLFPTAIPIFKGEPMEFVHRAYMGAAIYSKFTMAYENEPMYANILRSVKDMKGSNELSKQYEYAMALQNFTWISQEEGEVEKRLLALSKQGHPGAMYEYGMKLYREQTDIEEALKWIGRSSAYGLTHAEYRLGRLFVTSPWVEYDEQKALFWLELAAEKDHAAAALKAAELKLITTNDTLKDVVGAVSLLEKIEDQQNTNPEYYYVLALSHKNRINRDYTQVIKNLKKAIFMGSSANWDVSEWQDLLSRLRQGNVTIVE